MEHLKFSFFSPFSRAMTVNGIVKSTTPTNSLLNQVTKDFSDSSFLYRKAIKLTLIFLGLRLLTKWKMNFYANSSPPLSMKFSLSVAY